MTNGRNEKMKEAERAVLLGVNAEVFTDEENASEETLDELEALLETAGGICVARALQNRSAPDPKTLIGEGKAREIREAVMANNITLAVVDNDLSPSQMKALEEALGCRVIDRSALILDIFASRARTREGKLQVELAQYQYILPRLAGLGTSLSRLGGGIGTRGPGETKLESDRRHIRSRIARLSDELEEVRRVRATQRRRREKNEIPLVAIVGYTNAGKSTLLNTLTGAGIEANDRLFDTLDPTTRALQLDETTQVLMSDTVGFIRKLPHHLVSAFKATLEELTYADVLLHVVDASNPLWPKQMDVVEGLIRELGAEKTPCIRVYNKADACGEPEILPRGEDAVFVSALYGRGMEQLREKMISVLNRGRRRVHLLLPYDQSALLDLLYREASVESVEYAENGIDVHAVCDEKLYGRMRQYRSEEHDGGQ